jgi:radical SAM superfamily enzyme YgiQ (UPF0313 family)
LKILLTTLNSKFIHTNLAIRYLKSFANDLADIDIREYTINNELDFILKDIFFGNYDVVLFSTYIWNVEDISRICDNLKMVNPNIIIALGGPEVTYDSVEFMKNHQKVDYILYGEGELVFRDFVRFLKKEMKVEDVKGLVYRKSCEASEIIKEDSKSVKEKNMFIKVDNQIANKDNILTKEYSEFKKEDNKTIKTEIVKNEEMPLIENLDIIPSPYENISPEEYENKIVYYESSRGCPFNCQYCLSSTLKNLRYFSIERVKKDLKALIDARVSQIKFIDRTFNAKSDIAMEIMRFLSENDNGFTTYHFEVTAHLIDDTMLDFLKNVKEGLFQFEIGVQSTNQMTLDEVGRRDDFQKLSRVVQTIESYRNIHQHLDLIAGLPYEPYESFEKSFNDVFNLGIEHLQLGFLKMIKGTGMRKKAKQHGFKYKSYPPYEVLSNDYISYSEISKLKDIEEILERYFNSKNFILSVKFIIDRFYSQSPFKFFEELAIYHDEKGYFKLAQSKNTQYKILLDFYEDICLGKINKLEKNKKDLVDSSRDFEECNLKDKNAIQQENKSEDVSLKESKNKSEDVSLNESKNISEDISLNEYKNKSEVVNLDSSKNISLELFNDVLKYDYISLGKTSSIPDFFNKTFYISNETDVPDEKEVIGKKASNKIDEKKVINKKISFNTDKKVLLNNNTKNLNKKELDKIIKASNEMFKDRCHKFLQNENNLKKYLEEFVDVPAKNIVRVVHFEVFKYNINDLKENINCDIIEKENVVLFDYSRPKIFEKSKTYSVKL